MIDYSVNVYSVKGKYLTSLKLGELIGCKTVIDNKLYQFDIPGPFSMDFILRVIARVTAISHNKPNKITFTTPSKNNYKLMDARIKSITKFNYISTNEITGTKLAVKMM